MAGMSKITLVGNLLSDPRSSETSSGIPVTRFQVSVEREARGQAQSAPETVIDYYTVSAFGQSGSSFDHRFRAGEFGVGSRLLVMGKLELREWSDAQGPQFALEVTADEVFDLGPDSVGEVRSLLAGNAPSRVLVVGRLGGDPEMRPLPSGGSVASFSIAVSRPVSRQSVDREEVTNWYRISAWANMAERVQKLADMAAIAKGKKLLVEGTFVPRQWQDNSGQRRVSLDVNLRDFELMQGRDDTTISEGFGGQRDQYGSRSVGGNAGGNRGNRGGYQDDPFGDRGGRGGGRQDDPFGNSGDRGNRSGRQDENFGGGQDVDDIPF
jgi:single-strand DNA-binding protein